MAAIIFLFQIGRGYIEKSKLFVRKNNGLQKFSKRIEKKSSKRMNKKETIKIGEDVKKYIQMHSIHYFITSIQHFGFLSYIFPKGSRK